MQVTAQPIPTPNALDASENYVVQGSSLGSEGGSDSQKAAASGSSRQQQHQANRRQHQQHELQTPGNAARRSAAQLGGDVGPSLMKELR